MGYNRSQINGVAEIPSSAVHNPTHVQNGSPSFLDSDGEDAEILKILDRLRELGLEQKYELPQILVCGAQSAGKSSTLEAITGIPFPSDKYTCTKYVTEVTLERRREERVTVRITAHIGRSAEEQDELNKFNHDFLASEAQYRLPELMQSATALIFRGRTENAKFARDRLRVTISGPNKRPLQLLDLPGLIGFSGEGEEAVEMVEKLTIEEMEKQCSTILAVISAQTDYNNAKVLTHCRKYDPDGQRTLGVITCPDMQGVSQAYVDVLCNRDNIPQELRELKMQWHVLRNGPKEERANRDERERGFFTNDDNWKHVPAAHRGVDKLRDRLRDILFSVAKEGLPKIMGAMRIRKEQLEEEIISLGCDSFTDDELRARFRAVIDRLKNNARDHARGIYESNILEFDVTDPIRLRSRIVEESEIFRDRLLKHGNTWNPRVYVTPLDPDHDLKSLYKKDDLAIKGLKNSVFENEGEEVAHVAQIIVRTRGQEAPGYARHDVRSEVFWHLSKNWKLIADWFVDAVHSHCCKYFEQAVPLSFAQTATERGFGNANRVADRYLQILFTKIDHTKCKALEELETLERERKGQPVDYIRRFEGELRRHRENATMAGVNKAMNKISTNTREERWLTGSSLAEDIGKHTQEQNIHGWAKDYAIAAWIHYDIVRDHFLTNVIVQVIERHFMRDIGGIIPEQGLSIEDLRELVRPERHLEVRKAKLEKELDMLKKSLDVLQTSWQTN
ncbi:hypothetical protein AOQ84DRAFT_393696 [Glonium stellatum]|uniref:Dynamin-type G domain-containing protein n=1 Tax=Glonium stellatum TaxID=574774 RepID=A0A8E2JLA2_9PEZI|nr:hypothetical protein AOQ84DRAFT_393696 [Glonium stellatum]